MPEVTPSPAATVTLVRDSPRGVEVLMLQRSHSLKFMPGAHVFPGGGLDAAGKMIDLRDGAGRFYAHRRSLHAHLLKLQGEKRVVVEGEAWRLMK